MKKFQFSLMTIAAGLFLTFNSCENGDISTSPEEQMNRPTELLSKPSNVSSKMGASKVSGFGSIHLAVDDKRQFSFHANRKSDGIVYGNGLLVREAIDLEIKFDINCLIVNGNMATLGGLITQWDDYPEAIGWHCWFMVIDNGEGKNANPDQISFWYYWPPDPWEDCFEYPSIDLYDIDGGNVQVK